MLAVAVDGQAVARFYIWQSLGFGGKPGSGSFAAAPTQPRAKDPAVLQRHIERAHKRLARVTIENLPYGEFIDRYDRPGTLFYVDPPYWGTEGVYGKGMFEKADFERLAEQLGRISGRFILSINDTAETRRIFKGFHARQVNVTYSTKEGPHHRAKELIVSGRGVK